jgi:hypothetical protein
MKRFLKFLSIPFFILIGIIGIIFFLVGFLYLLRLSTCCITSEGHINNINEIKISNEFSQEKLLEFIPDFATDIRYCVRPYAQDLNVFFFVSQEDFEPWVSQKMTTWNLEKRANTFGGEKKLGSISHIAMFSEDGGGAKRIISVCSEGYYRGKTNDGSSIEIIYNEKEQRCSLKRIECPGIIERIGNKIDHYLTKSIFEK